jgi:hypothetical protein
VAGVLHHLGDGGHARPGDSGEVNLHFGVGSADLSNAGLNGAQTRVEGCATGPGGRSLEHHGVPFSREGISVRRLRN